MTKMEDKIKKLLAMLGDEEVDPADKWPINVLRQDTDCLQEDVSNAVALAIITKSEVKDGEARVNMSEVIDKLEEASTSIAAARLAMVKAAANESVREADEK